MGGMYEHAGDVAADNEAPVMYHRILCSPQYDDEYYFAKESDYKTDYDDDDFNCNAFVAVRLLQRCVQLCWNTSF